MIDGKLEVLEGLRYIPIPEALCAFGGKPARDLLRVHPLRLCPRVDLFVVFIPTVRMTENVEGLGDDLKSRLSFDTLIARISVGMMLERELTKRISDLLIRGVPLDTQSVV
jgi:hypothetical protein